MQDLPVIDLTKWFSREESDGARAGCEAECRLVADALQRFGILIVKVGVWQAGARAAGAHRSARMKNGSEPLWGSFQYPCPVPDGGCRLPWLLPLPQDPRATEADNDTFLDMLEKYMGQPDDVKAADIRKELHYSVRASVASRRACSTLAVAGGGSTSFSPPALPCCR